VGKFEPRVWFRESSLTDIWVQMQIRGPQVTKIDYIYYV
jgi:hypothetical protein